MILDNGRQDGGSVEPSLSGCIYLGYEGVCLLDGLV